MDRQPSMLIHVLQGERGTRRRQLVPRTLRTVQAPPPRARPTVGVQFENRRQRRPPRAARDVGTGRGRSGIEVSRGCRRRGRAAHGRGIGGERLRRPEGAPMDRSQTAGRRDPGRHPEKRWRLRWDPGSRVPNSFSTPSGEWRTCSNRRTRKTKTGDPAPQSPPPPIWTR